MTGQTGKCLYHCSMAGDKTQLLLDICQGEFQSVGRFSKRRRFSMPPKSAKLRGRGKKVRHDAPYPLYCYKYAA
jgi:hypothetical protein